MGKEIDLLMNYPKTNRAVEERGQEKTEEDRRIGRKFGKEYFDGDRRYGYGGFSYHPRFWQPVIKTFQEYYHLGPNSTILDVGCAKGFMLYDFSQLIPGITVKGIDISEYAISNAKDEVKSFLQVADARKLPFKDKSFDLVISINTVHNLNREDCKIALQEIERVSKANKFITVDAYRTAEDRNRMNMWNLTALTFMKVDEWEKFFDEIGYTGNYYWFIP